MEHIAPNYYGDIFDGKIGVSLKYVHHQAQVFFLLHIATC